jgi:uncharacterized membrane protein
MISMMLVPIIILVIFIIFYLNPSNERNSFDFRRDIKSNNALDILDRRFANGEISEEEYIKRRSILK